MASGSYNISLITGIARSVKNAIESNTDGLRDTVNRYGGGMSPFVKPTPDGLWPAERAVPGARSAGTTWMWLRNVTDTTLAPMPTAADGYVPGDLVSPMDSSVASGAATSSATMLWSDSFRVAANADFTTRTGDAFAGGSAPSWQTDTSQKVADGRVRVMTDYGLNLYSATFARAVAPALPSSGAWRLSFALTLLNPSNGFAIGLRAASYLDTNRTRLKLSNVGGSLVAAVDDTTAGTTTIGQAAFAAGAKIVVQYDGTTVNVNVGGLDLPAAVTPTALPRLTELSLQPFGYNDVGFRDITMEVL